MLGFIGFISAAAAIIAFVWTAQKPYTTVEPQRLKAFSVGFGLLALAMLVWAAIVIRNDTVTTHDFMLVSDVLLLLGTACMVLVVAAEYSASVLTLLGGLVALLISYRAYVQPPTAYVHDGLLYFNLQGSSRFFIVGLFAFIWLPAAMIVANRVANNPLLRNRRLSLQMYFVALVALLACFAKARRTGAIIALFALIVFVFILLTMLNLALNRASKVSVDKRSRGHAS